MSFRMSGKIHLIQIQITPTNKSPPTSSDLVLLLHERKSDPSNWCPCCQVARFHLVEGLVSDDDVEKFAPTNQLHDQKVPILAPPTEKRGKLWMFSPKGKESKINSTFRGAFWEALWASCAGLQVRVQGSISQSHDSKGVTSLFLLLLIQSELQLRCLWKLCKFTILS